MRWFEVEIMDSKGHLVAAMIISILLISIALQSQSYAASTATVMISASVKPTVQLDYANETATWAFTPTTEGNQTRLGTITVKANTDWQLVVEDTNPETSGYMTKWDGQRYGSSKLAEPLVVSAEREVALPIGGIIQTGSRTSGQEVNIILIQRVLATDLPRHDNHRITITLRGLPLV